MRRFWTTALAMLILGGTGIVQAADEAGAIKPEEVKLDRPVDFEQDIFPLLDANCIACHNLAIKENNLNLEDVVNILKGGKRGPSVVPGDPEKSLLYKVAARGMAPAMPPLPNKVEAKALTPRELGLLKLWITEGATAGMGGDMAQINWQRLSPGMKAIYAVALSEDGQYVACGRANQIFVYHVPTGRLMTQLVDPNLTSQKSEDGQPLFGTQPAHRDFVHSLAFNHDGTILASGGFRTVKLWRRPDNAARFQLAAGAAAVTSVAVSPDGKWAATGTADKTLKVWNLTDGKEAKTLAGHTDAITAVAFSPDSTKLFSGSADQSIRIWTLADGAAAGRIDTPAAVTSLALSADGLQVYSGGKDNLIHTWTVPATATRQLAQLPETSPAMDVSADRKWLAIAGTDGKVTIIDLTTNQLAKTLEGHAGAVSAVSFSANAARLATSGVDKTIRIWDLATGQPVAVLSAGTATVTSAALHPNGLQVATATSTGAVSLYKLDVAEARLLTGDNGIPATVTAVSPDGKLLAAAGTADGKAVIFIRDITSGAVTKTLAGHEGAVTALAFSADNARVISGSADKTARIWNLADGAEVIKFAGHTAGVTAVALMQNGQQAVSGTADNAVKLWNVADAAELKSFAGHTGAITAVTVVGNGPVVSGSADQTIRVWNPADGAQQRSIAAGQPVAAFAISRDGAKLAVVGNDQNVKLYQFADGKELFVLAGHTAAAKTVSFSADNTRLITTGADNLANLWDVATGARLETYAVEGGSTFADFALNQPNTILLGRGDKSIQVVTTRFERSMPGIDKPVTDLLYNKGGDAIYASVEDGTIRRFATGNGQQQFSANHGAVVHDIALSPDGNWLASAGENQQVRVWNAGNGANGPKPQFDGFGAPVKSVAISADNLHVLGGTADGKVLVFHLQNGGMEQAFREQTGAVEALAAGGEKFERIFISADKSVRDATFAAGIIMTGHGGPVTSLALVLPPNGQLLSGSDDGTVRQWTIANGQMVRQMGHGAPVTAVAVRPDGQHFASASANNTAKIWNAGNGQQIVEFKGDVRAQRVLADRTLDDAEAKATTTAAMNAIKPSEDDAKAKAEAVTKATEAQTAAAKVVTDATAKAKDLEEKFNVAKKAADDKTDDAALAKAKTDAEKLFTDATAELKKAQEGKTAADKALDLANKASTDAQATIVKTKAAHEAAVAAQTVAEANLKAATEASTATEKPIRGIAYSADSKLLATVSDDQLVHLYNAQDGAALSVLAGHQGPVTSVVFGSDDTLLTASADQTAKVWDLNPEWQLGGQLGPNPEAPLELGMSPFANRVLALDFNGDGTLLAAGGGDPSRSGEVMIWDVAKLALVRNITDAHSDTVFGIEFSRDGKYLVSGAADKFVKIFEVETGKHVRSFEGHTHHVMDVSWQGNGQTIASAGADNVIKVWTVETGEQQRTIQGYAKQVTSLTFVGRSINMISCGGDATVRLHRADNGQNYRNFGGAGDYMYAAASTPDEKVVVAGGEDGVLRVWNGTNAQPIITFEMPKPPEAAAETQAATAKP